MSFRPATFRQNGLDPLQLLKTDMYGIERGRRIFPVPPYELEAKPEAKV